jgi:hypothetical protein
MDSAIKQICLCAVSARLCGRGAVAGRLPDVDGKAEPKISRRDDGSFVIDAATPIGDVAARLDLKEPSEQDFVTVAGLVLSKLDHGPLPGTRISHDGWDFEILEIEGTRIKKLLASAATGRISRRQRRGLEYAKYRSLPAEQDRLVLCTTRHVHDLARREADSPAQAEQKIRMVGDRRFRLRFRLDACVAHAMTERVARAIGGRWMLDVKVRMHNRAADAQQTVGFAQIIFQLRFQEMREQRVGEYEIERIVGERNAID